MTETLILASGSPIRAQLLRNAGVRFDITLARVDEAAILAGLEAEGVRPVDIAGTLAEAKARKVSLKSPGRLVIGCDQVLALGDRILTKVETVEEARGILQELSGKEHRLFSAAVICEDGKPTWRHVGQVRLQMHSLSEDYITDYLARNWDSVREAVGCYKLEEEGPRLFARIDGDYFSVLGLPLLQLLSYLTLRGTLSI